MMVTQAIMTRLVVYNISPRGKAEASGRTWAKTKTQTEARNKLQGDLEEVFCKLLIFIRDLRTRKYLANDDPLARPTPACCQNNLFALFFEMAVCVWLLEDSSTLQFSEYSIL